MYYPRRLDSPPPPSQFRRPWSPDPYDPLPSSSRVPHNDYPSRQREPSDVSVEALDLADYARTLQPYTGFRAEPQYPPSPPIRPLASRLSLSRDRDTIQAPSPVSRGDTLSSGTHDPSSYSRYPAPRRPFSLPARSQREFPMNSYPHVAPDPAGSLSGAEIDVTQFPSWSQNWYNERSKNRTKSKSPPEDMYDASPYGQPDSSKRSPFDPAYAAPSLPASDGYYSWMAPPPTSSLGHESTRDLLPWSGDPPSYDPPMDAALKEERMRMLEREFGSKPRHHRQKDDKGKARSDPAFLDDEGKPLIGTVDEKGNLVTQGPKKRAATRVLQILLAIGAGIPAIFAALAIKPKSPPPPANKPPAFILYVLSVLTILALLYLFVARPCCIRKRKPAPGSGPGLGNGMMVMPVQGLPGGKGKKKDKGMKGKRGKGMKGGMPGMGDVQVNLIVDPGAFQPPDLSSSSDEETEFPGAFDSDGYASSSQRRHAKAKRARAKRRGVFAGLAMEEAWKAARSWMKKMALFDAIAMLLWGAEFVYILIGKRCPSGAFEGWCNAYNTSTASACLLAVAFGASTFFNVKDLSSSKVSPRTRI
ncbi:hypothetical protein HGRIS_012905 [Hohenbuehelia grisea]|uniref:Uncharacterized protein n=1 Tax=Hohenbuehelia grisea TaxID=104357 RepID=A0ABR3ITZ0_9AGAR